MKISSGDLLEALGRASLAGEGLGEVAGLGSSADAVGAGSRSIASFGAGSLGVDGLGSSAGIASTASGVDGSSESKSRSSKSKKSSSVAASRVPLTSRILTISSRRSFRTVTSLSCSGQRSRRS